MHGAAGRCDVNEKEAVQYLKKQNCVEELGHSILISTPKYCATRI